MSYFKPLNEGFQGSLLHKFIIKTSQPFIRATQNYYKSHADESKIFKKISEAVMSINGFDRKIVIPERVLRDRFDITNDKFKKPLFNEAQKIKDILTISQKNENLDIKEQNIFGMQLGFNPYAYFPGGKLGDIENVNKNYNYFLSNGFSMAILKPPGKGHSIGFIFKVSEGKIDKVYCLIIHIKENDFELKPYNMKFINSINPKTYLKSIMIG